MVCRWVFAADFLIWSSIYTLYFWYVKFCRDLILYFLCIVSIVTHIHQELHPVYLKSKLIHIHKQSCMFQHACICVHACGLVNDTVSSGDHKHQILGWIQIWKDMEGSIHSPIWSTIPTFSWNDCDKPQETLFRIVSLRAQIWIQTPRIQNRSADTSTMTFVPNFYHLSHCYTLQGLLVLHTV
jgi:hypothetical protein